MGGGKMGSHKMAERQQDQQHAIKACLCQPSSIFKAEGSNVATLSLLFRSLQSGEDECGHITAKVLGSPKQRGVHGHRTLAVLGSPKCRGVPSIHNPAILGIFESAGSFVGSCQWITKTA